jgi:aldose 1-epimerase
MANLETLKQAFITQVKGASTVLVVLKNQKGTQVGICNYGARITHFIVQDQQQNWVDVVLGFNSIQEYLTASELYHGVTAGPFANRIAEGKFSLGNITYQLEQNNGLNNLHSGTNGFHAQVWDVVEQNRYSVLLSITYADNEGGFPGPIQASVKFTLTDDDELVMDYKAGSQKNTIINLTNHAYFNLNGEGSGTILNHVVKINAQSFVEINEACIPTGKFIEVENTAFDFSVLKPIAQDIADQDVQLLNGSGYDHSFVLNKSVDGLSHVATAIGDISNLKLEVFTTEPGMQFYTGNFLNAKDKGKAGNYYERRSGFCFETQHHPDSPNHPHFPSVLLNAGELFESKTVYKISV